MCEKRQKISLIGIGMGSRASMTMEAAEAVRACDCMIGAERMLSSARELRYGTGRQGDAPEQAESLVPELCEYNSDKIFAYIEAHPEYVHVAVLLSGDTGFHSGAKKLSEMFARDSDRYDVTMIPGISSVICLAARLKTTWEDGAVLSLHGQEENFIQTVNKNGKTFLLLGGKDSGEKMITRLKEYGMDDVTVHIGSRLSYPDEQILSGHPGELEEGAADGLCAAMILNPNPDKRTGPHIRDEEFIRGNVPMTKAEVRAVSLAQMELAENSVVYDIGAGTGSVSVEAARSGDRIRVYAIEKKPEAAELLVQNRKKFRTDGIRIIKGTAPEALRDLEPPTHVFIGGSSGNLREILCTVLDKNPSARIVINAISLETVSEVMDAIEEGLLKDAQITQITAARARVLGRYHMMTGQNPVYIISSGRDRKENPAETERSPDR
ncbi:MAG TPA: precorrin-6Y C5,15-methyltransferase (decarboxylating) subunit CbiT [Candidatus Mediterraneibacter pullistercoris]|nr:precorrin-6Y C5,15-methyltransferase (decarboxylating) subunit CbiT [Candidatus Mediterraneibacter pullistercoris]